MEFYRFIDGVVLNGSGESSIRKPVQPLLSHVAVVLCSILRTKKMCSEWNRNGDVTEKVIYSIRCMCTLLIIIIDSEV